MLFKKLEQILKKDGSAKCIDTEGGTHYIAD